MTERESRFFVSYAREDGEFVLRLARDLRAGGVPLWMDQLDFRGGERWDHAIERALNACGSLIVVLSSDSVESNNVLDELSFALEEHKLVVPVLVRACDVPFLLRRVQRIDFTGDDDAALVQLRMPYRTVHPRRQPPPCRPHRPRRLIDQRRRQKMKSSSRKATRRRRVAGDSAAQVHGKAAA